MRNRTKKRPKPPAVKQAIDYARRLELGFKMMRDDYMGEPRPRKRGKREREATDED